MDRLLFSPAWGIEQNYSDWLTTLFPSAFNRPISAEHQRRFWEWVWSVNAYDEVAPFVWIVARGGGKTTSTEAASVKFGAAGKRFCLYVRGTQAKANESIMNISSFLESSRVESYYPELANRKVGKYGQSKSWSQKVLRTAGGYSIVGLGMDAAVRGIKIEEDRPDVIIFDDVDDARDSYNMVTKKIETITNSILPAASLNPAILFVQNLIHANSIAAKLVDTSSRGARFLINREVVGPIPAIRDLVTERNEAGRDVIVSGEPTWEGQDLEICQKQIDTFTLESFLTESQHEVQRKEGLVYFAFDADKHVMAPYEMPDQIVSGRMPIYTGHDFGAVNTVMLIAYRDHDGTLYVKREVSFPHSTTSAKVMLARRNFRGNTSGSWGGSGSEDEIRLNWQEGGIDVHAPPHVNDVGAQVNATNQLFADGKLIISAECEELIFQLGKCRYDEKERIEDKSIWHMLDALRSLCDGIGGGVRVGLVGSYTNR